MDNIPRGKRALMAIDSEVDRALGRSEFIGSEPVVETDGALVLIPICGPRYREQSFGTMDSRRQDYSRPSV